MTELLTYSEIANIRTEAHAVIDGLTMVKPSTGAVMAAEVIVELCHDHDAQAQRIEELEAGISSAVELLKTESDVRSMKGALSILLVVLSEEAQADE